MTTAPLVCELCEQGPLEPFDVPGSTMLQYCPHCELYQQGRMVEKDAYEDEYHAGYDKHRPHKVRTARLRLNRIASLLEDRRSARLLEIGCSVGATLEAAVQRGWDAVGVDVSESAVAACRERGFSAEVVGPLDLPFDSHSFDVVCAWHVIEHVQDVRTTLREWSRVLRPGGLLVIETPDANCPKAKRLGPKYRKFWSARAYLHLFPAEPRTLLHRSGTRHRDSRGDRRLEWTVGKRPDARRDQSLVPPDAPSRRSREGVSALWSSPSGCRTRFVATCGVVEQESSFEPGSADTEVIAAR
ncbi:MAG: class I SAM-dependent methyltransferase [Pirellulaceae bacterium]